MSYIDRKHRLFQQFTHRNKTVVANAFDTFFKGVKSEAQDAKKTRIIIQTYVTKGDIHKEDEKFLKSYIINLLKIAGIGIPFILLPGATIIIPFIVKLAEKKIG